MTTGADDAGKREVIGTSEVASMLGVTQRQAQRVILKAQDTKEIPIIGRLGARGDYIVSRAAVRAWAHNHGKAVHE